MKIRDLDRAKLLAPIDAATAHPPYARAMSAEAEAKQALVDVKAKLDEHKKMIELATSRIQNGHEKADALDRALVAQRTCALLCASAEKTLTAATAKVTTEAELAKAVVQREVNRRLELVEGVIADVSPVLTDANEISQALVSILHPGALSTIDWPCSGSCFAARRTTALSSTPAAPLLVWSGSNNPRSDS